MQDKLEKKEQGFLLLELLVSVSIFIIIVTMAVASLVVVFDSHRHTASIRLALDNANFALNSITREMRLSSKFKCPDSQCDGDSEIEFDYFGKKITYRLTNKKTIEKKIGSGPFLPLTADKYEINSLRFTQSGTVPDFIKIYINGSVTVGSNTTEFNLQTSVSSRQF